MKKVFTGLIVFAILLTGCAGKNNATTDTTADTVISSSRLWEKDSAVEQETKGAVRQYTLAQKNYDRISGIGDQVLLIHTDKKIQLQMLSGAEGVPAGNISLDAEKTAGLQVTYNGVLYYDKETKQAVFLNSQLKETRTYPLPEELEGTPVFAQTGDYAFYCVGKDIWAYDLEQGISRIVKSQNCKKQTLLNVYFDGKLLSCRVEDESGKEKTVWISAQTGQTLYTDDAIRNLWTFEDSFFATRADGTVEQRIFGAMEGDFQEMTVKEGSMASALPLGGAIGWKFEDKQLQLAMYDLQSGKKTGAVAFETAGQPKGVFADRWSHCVWLLVSNPESGDTLLRWDIQASAVEKKDTYISKLFTKDSPDEEGLEACQQRVDALNRKHGVYIRIWEHAAKYPTGIALEAEYQVSAINRVLDELEEILDKLPENFLYKSVKSTIRICVVRSIDGSQTAAGHYWFDGDGFVVLSAGADIEQQFLKGIGNIIDSHVLGNSPQYDYWNNTNPAGFVYGDNATYKQKYLSGETRAFADAESMESATDDRSRVFWNAMLKDNGQMFESETMQKKLKEICVGIRDAWRWENKTDIFPWEQYLKEPIAYKETK